MKLPKSLGGMLYWMTSSFGLRSNFSISLEELIDPADVTSHKELPLEQLNPADPVCTIETVGGLIENGG